MRATNLAIQTDLGEWNWAIPRPDSGTAVRIIFLQFPRYTVFMPVQDPTQRFSSRVENYVRYRPGYPPAVIDLLKNECALTPSAVIADVASGTGIFTRLLLENGNRVYGVEPNQAMRESGEASLASYRNFTSVHGTAEDTTLSDTSVDLVTAAQAAHWFDRDRALEEFRRVLKPAGYLVLI